MVKDRVTYFIPFRFNRFNSHPETGLHYSHAVMRLPVDYKTLKISYIIHTFSETQ